MKSVLVILAVVTTIGATTFAAARLRAASPAATTSHPTPTRACDPGNLVLFGHVKSVTPKGRSFELRFDPAVFTSGLTASRAMLEDTGSGDVANDNYIVDEGHRLFTYVLPPSARITVLARKGPLDSSGFPSRSITASQLRELLAGRSPVELFERLSTGFWMNVHVDTVCSLRQQYQP
jgi:hypothetical protein